MALLVHGLGSFGPRSGFQKALIRRLKNPTPTNGSDSADRNISGVASSNLFGKVVYPDTSRMVIYDPRQTPCPPVPGISSVTTALPYGVTPSFGGTMNELNDMIKTLPLALAAFVANLPAVEGFCLNSSIHSQIKQLLSDKIGF